MSIWTILEGGNNMPLGDTWGQRLSLWVGRWLATRHKNVQIDPSARISPETHINPRKGRISIGANTTVAMGAVIQGNVIIGYDSSVQANTMMIGYGGEMGEGRITVGNYVRIAPFVMMIAANHRFADPNKPIHHQGMDMAPITIEDDVWIGGKVVLTAGVTIGKGSVIGAGAVVTKDIPPYSIAVGVPARVVKSRR